MKALDFLNNLGGPIKKGLLIAGGIGAIILAYKTLKRTPDFDEFEETEAEETATPLQILPDDEC